MMDEYTYTKKRTKAFRFTQIQDAIREILPRTTETGDPHWKCPDCWQMCYCDPPVQGMSHVACGNRGTNDENDLLLPAQG